MASTIIANVDAFGKIPSAPSFVNHITVVPGTSAVTTGGFDIGLQALVGSGNTIAFVSCEGVTTSTGQYDPTRTWAYNTTSNKLQVFSVGASPAEITSGDLSTLTVHIFVTSY